eukprot:TRINITY_DN12140_c0_g1_i1.p1 TRINITY_DN12140_c0_g1~~TRINITY_DN12140_c0_g1_i1.p1  ORF type:complete len:251 (-),score=15.08 TRINITY_DN12140_c0_g1_i1:103-855(-)
MSFILIALLCVILLVSLQLLVSSLPNLDARAFQQLHIRRKIQHVLSGLLLALLAHVNVLSWRSGSILIFCCSLLIFILHMLRLRFALVNEYFLKMFGPLLREDELTRLPGCFWFLVGCGCSLFFFASPLPILSILLLSIGDPVAALCGQLYSFRNKRVGQSDGKTIVGSVCMFCVCFLTTFLYLGICQHDIDWGALLLWSFVSAFIASLTETLPLPLDDNLSIPVISCFLLSILQSSHIRLLPPLRPSHF